MANPAAFVPTVTEEAMPAPLKGPAKITLILATGLPAASTTLATSGAPKAVLIAALCGLPEDMMRPLGGAGSIDKVNDPLVVCFGIVESLTLKLTVLVPCAGAVPEITPVALFNVRPVGSPLAVQV